MAGGVRWNDESQSWESEPPRAFTPPPPAPPIAPPMPPRAPEASGREAPDPYAQDPYAQDPDPYAPPPQAPGPYPQAGPHTTGDTGVYNNLTGTHRPPGAGGGLRERIMPLTAGLVVAGLAVGAAVLWLVVPGGDGGGDDARGRRAGASAEVTDPALAEPDAEPTRDPSAGDPADGGTAGDGTADTASPAAPPEGYVTHDDAQGFRITAPEAWTDRVEETGGVFYRSPDRTALLQVFRVSEPGITALRAVRTASAELEGNPGFEEVRIGSVEPPFGGEAAELVYAYDSEDAGGRRQVVERVFTAPDGRLYAVLAAGPASDWPLHEEVVDVAVRSFDPYGEPF